MPLTTIIITLIIAGIILWLINKIPMDGTVLRIINVVAIIVIVVWLLQVFGLIGYLNNIHIK